MKRRDFLLAASAVAAWPLGAAAQAAGVPRVGLLFVNSVEQERAMFGDDPFGFGDLGYVEGKNIAFESRYAGGDSERLAALAKELVGLKVDVIVTGGPGVYAAHRATTDIPIVAGSIGDPVGYGFAASLAHPGGNVTGSALFGPQLLAKRLELLKLIVPSLKRAGVLLVQDLRRQPATYGRHGAHSESVERGIVADGSRRPQHLRGRVFGGVRRVHRGNSDHGARAASRQRGGHRIARQQTRTAERGRADPCDGGRNAGLRRQHKGPFHSAATFVDKILKGAKAGDIPFEQATKFETVVNLKSAQALGLVVPPGLLAQATKVIE